jgi:hypothetical protein
MTLSGTPSRASSTASAWRSWCGAKRRRTPAWAASPRINALAAGRRRAARGSLPDLAAGTKTITGSQGVARKCLLCEDTFEPPPSPNERLRAHLIRHTLARARVDHGRPREPRQRRTRESAPASRPSPPGRNPAAPGDQYARRSTPLDDSVFRIRNRSAVEFFREQ